MSISVFDLFKIGIGPSSSHTVGPMKAAREFAALLRQRSLLNDCATLEVELFGSLAATGEGHGSLKAIQLGLLGEDPATVDVESIEQQLEQIRTDKMLNLLREKFIHFDPDSSLQLKAAEVLPFHPNGMRFTALDASRAVIISKCYFSVGGGFVVDDSADEDEALLDSHTSLAFPFGSAKELLEFCKRRSSKISDIMMANEMAWRSRAEVSQKLKEIRETMFSCIDAGCKSDGILPGGLNVRRRAASLFRSLQAQEAASNSKNDALAHLDWVTLFALAVNEVNAMGGRLVTAPTNGAAGIVPAVLRYYMDFCDGANEEQADRFLLTAGAIGILYKTNASISGAEVGCQGEVGSACSMAAGALTEVLGGSLEQVENAAEIAMEHNLGLTCDPIKGLVQVPCIERNAMAAIKAISAARMALNGDGKHHVSLDQVIQTMRDTGRDMQAKYKETALGGLAVTVQEVPVSIIEC